MRAATLAIVAVLLAATPVASQTAQFSVTVDRSSDLADADTVQVTLAGTPAGQGLYVRLCAEPPLGERPPAEACDGSGLWATLPPGTPQVPGQPLVANQGTLSFDVRVTFNEVDCTVVQCGIHTRRDHQDGTDTRLDRFVPITFAAGVPGGPRTVERVSGANRFATAAALSAATWPDGAAVVYIATGSDYTDALAGGPAATRAGGPLLLVATDTVPTETDAELDRLAPEAIVVLGGENAISSAVAEQLAAHAPVTRLAGTSRYATAAAVAAHGWPDGARDVVIATGAAYADALAGGAAGGMIAAPILLVTRDAIPAETLAELERLAPQRITLLGGSEAISADVESQLAQRAATFRLAGSSRFATAASVAQTVWPGGSRAAIVATGEAFADALAASAIGGHHRVPVLLVTRDAAPAETLSALDHLGVGTVLLAGGPGTISDAVAAQLGGG